MKFFLLFGFPYIQGSHDSARISHKVHDHLLTIFGVKPHTVFYTKIMYISKSKMQQATVYPSRPPIKPLWDSLESSSLRSIDQFVFEREWSLKSFQIVFITWAFKTFILFIVRQTSLWKYAKTGKWSDWKIVQNNVINDCWWIHCQ